ncbi:putative pentatricopeptide repeat-containing protein At1g12700, mitochondrial [Corylus avellana]|uniref:putative pentatricopeptide repeat-containing protein At1g12700, mitochondrial n=1 Tax=Corylus avellana TaxID=13451 RepID=UPI00286A3487|nr:putative pentatricopeptide repeat-containing protein At1g12700, mitochondrial [Corylus avellana]
MSNNRMIPDVVTYNTLIGGFCRARRPHNALELLHDMQACGQRPNLQTYAILLDGHCKNLHFYEAMALFLDMEDQKFDFNLVIYVLIDGMCTARKLMTAKEPFNSLPTKGLQPDVRTYTIMIKGLCKEGLLNEVSELLEKMDKNGYSADDVTYNTTIQGSLQHNETSWAINYLLMMVNKGFSANATTATILIDLLSTNEVDKTLQYFFFQKFV